MGRANNLILGTAGHIDHGKTALVHALTGVDTDRLIEEKKRGITIELGFAPYAPTEEWAFGIVDVPGHEGFVRAMVAGATGMDVVLLVVAADEGVMPQTREHMAIVGLLDVDAMVVAVTKADLVDDEWLELVHEDVQDLLEGTRYRDAEVIPTSIRDPASLARLSEALLRCAAAARERTAEDLFRLPVDRVFAVEGTGTVVTGTLWSGRLARGEVVRILPGGGEARVRAIQVHGEQVSAAIAGQRTAVALTGATVRRGLVARGDVLVTDSSWSPSMMLTVELVALAGSGWTLEAGQRVRIHLGTVEVMARLALFGAAEVAPGDPALAQLRLEAPVVARSGDRFVVRSYSPVTTIAGGVVLEPDPPRRKRLSRAEKGALTAISRGGGAALAGAAALAGWAGLGANSVGVRAGWQGASVQLGTSERTRARLGCARTATGPGEPGRAAPGHPRPIRIGGAFFDPRIVSDGEARILNAVEQHHRNHSLEPGVPLAALRTSLPRQAHPSLADGLAAGLARDGALVTEAGLARLTGFEAALSADEEELARRLMEALKRAGLQAPTAEELAEHLATTPGALRPLLDFLAARGLVRLVGDTFWFAEEVLARASERIVEVLGGRDGLGPADFRKILPVTRRHLIPLLGHFDATGVTARVENARRVARSLE